MTELIQHSTVEAMVDAYKLAEADIRRAYELLEAAQKRVNAAFISEKFGGFDVSPRDLYGEIGAGAAKKVMDRMQRSALHAIIARLGIRPTLSEKRWRELEQQIAHGNLESLPAIEVDAIFAMVEGVAGQLSSYFVEAVTEVFEWLRQQGWMDRYKTNNRFEVRERVILWAVERDWGRRGFRVAYHRQQNVMALDNVFHLLDGKQRPPGSYWGPLHDAILASTDGCGETEYFKFKCFGNGNLHLKFRRMDLVAELNRVAGSGQLKGAA